MASLRVINSSEITEENISKFIPRNIGQLEEIQYVVLDIINQVKSKGDKALIELTSKYDNLELDESEIQVNNNEIDEAYTNIDEDLLNALRFAKNNLIKFHKAQIKEDWFINIKNGVKAGQIYRPLNSVGLYIPGGRAIYPSTVLMAATPAFVVGVKNIILCSPPQKNKKIAPEILVAAKEFKIDKIYRVGGAQAIAAMAYGTKTISKVQKVIGPGNKWVNTAKQLLSNTIAIDNPAGPSEILIIVDESSDVNLIALDFLSQLEHDPDNLGIILCHSSKIIKEINNHIDLKLQECERIEIIKAALEKSLIINTENLEDSIRISNIIAPEHLELLIKDPKKILRKINNAGAIFLGPFSPVPLGDYSAGTNHILPTGGNAIKYSGLNVYDFLKIIDVLECDKDGLKILSDSAIKIAEFEGLFAHKKSIEERLKRKN
ncbi:MAG: histidinol dehydrogenase [Candidatus Hermodarchaeota archaeon]